MRKVTTNSLSRARSSLTEAEGRDHHHVRAFDALRIIGPGLARSVSAAGETAADQITLRDGSVVKGLVTSVTNGPRGSVEVLVRRAWAEKALLQHVKAWDHSTTAATRLAIGQRRKRLEAWRRERAAGAGPDDRIIAWIDRELARLSAPGKPEPSILLRVRLRQ